MSEAEQGLHESIARYTLQVGSEAGADLCTTLTTIVQGIPAIRNGSMQLHIVDGQLGKNMECRWIHRIRDSQSLADVVSVLQEF